MVEMGNQRSEGVLSAEWDFPSLRTLWETSDTPIRRQLPETQVSQLMASLYARLQRDEPLQLDVVQEDTVEGNDDSMLTLDDLPVNASVTSRWPLPAYSDEFLSEDWAEEWGLNSDPVQPAESSNRAVRFDDETDEMDALPQHPDE